MARVGRALAYGARRLLATIVGFILLVLIAVVLILYTEPGTRVALETARRLYAQSIPGDVTVQDVDGAIGRGLELRGVRLEDSRGRPLIVAEHVDLRVAVGALFRGTLSVPRAEISDAEVHLWEEGGFEDLGSKKKKPKKKKPGIGPNLPVRIEADARLRDVDVMKHPTEGPVQRIAADAGARLRAWGEGQEAEATIVQMHGRAFDDALTVAALTAEVSWDSPKARIESLHAVTSHGRIDALEFAFDAKTFAWEGEGDLGLFVPENFGGPRELEGEVGVEFWTEGTPPGGWLTLHAEAGPQFDVTLAALLRFVPELRVATLLNTSPLTFEGTTAALSALARAQISPGKRLEARVAAVGTQDLRGAVLGADVFADLAASIWNLNAELEAPGTTARADAIVGGGKVVRADARLDADMGRTAAFLQPLAPSLPELEGGVEATAQCRRPGGGALRCRTRVEGTRLRVGPTRWGSVELEAQAQVEGEDRTIRADLEGRNLRVVERGPFDVQVDVEGTPEDFAARVSAQGRGRTRLRLDADVEREGEQTRVRLDTLEGRYQELGVELSKPAEISIGLEKVDVDELELGVGGGRVKIGGTYALDDGAHDLEFSVSRFGLGSLQSLLPQYDLEGQVEVDGFLKGPLRAPRARVDIEARRLRLDEQWLGSGRISAALDRSDLRVESTWTGGPVREARLAANLRVDPEDFELRPSPDASVALDVDVFDLAWLQPWLPEQRSLDGTVNLELLAKNFREPLLALELTGRSVRLDGSGPMGLHLVTSYADRVARVQANVKSRWLDEATLAATVPLVLRPAAMDWRLLPREGLQLAVVVDGLHLGRAPIPTERQVGGVVRGNLDARLVDGDVRLDLEVFGRGLEYGSVDLGAVALATEWDGQRVNLALQHSGPQARLVELQAKMPLDFQLEARNVEWNRHGEHELFLSLSDVELELVGALGGPSGLSGEVDGTVAMKGTVDSPMAGLELALDDLSYNRKAIGDVVAVARYLDERVELNVEQEQGASYTKVNARVPVALELEAPYVDWHLDERHFIEAQTRSLDRAVLAPFVEQPEGLKPRINLDMVGQGSVADFDLRARVRAELERDGIDTVLSAQLDASPKRQELGLIVGPFGPQGITGHVVVEAPLESLVRGTARWSDVPIDAQLSAEEFPMRALSPALPEALYGPEGELTLRATASGTLGNPEFGGITRIENGEITVVPLLQEFDDIQLAAHFEGGDIVIDELRSETGSGSVSVEGGIHLARGNTRGHLYVHANKFPVIRSGLPIMTVDAEIDAELDATAELTRIDVEIHDSFVDVLGQGRDQPSKIPTSEDVTFVDALAVPERKKEPGTTKTPIVPKEMRISLSIREPVLIRGNQADMAWDGAVKVVRRNEEVGVEGAFEAERGWFELLGNEFRLERGRVTLPERGEIDPYLDIEATTDTPEAVVTVNIEGRASRPELRLSSSPPMTDSQIFSLLVTGTADADGQEGDVQAKAASLLVSFQNPALQRFLRSSIGVDRVAVGFGETVEQPIVTVGKRITRELYAETSYHHNAPPDENQAEASLEYTFAPPHWVFRTYFGTAAEGGLGVWWRNRFGGPKKDEGDEELPEEDDEGDLESEEEDEGMGD